MTPTDLFALGRPAKPSSGADVAKSGKSGEAIAGKSQDFEAALASAGSQDEWGVDNRTGARSARTKNARPASGTNSLDTTGNPAQYADRYQPRGGFPESGAAEGAAAGDGSVGRAKAAAAATRFPAEDGDRGGPGLESVTSDPAVSAAESDAVSAEETGVSLMQPVSVTRKWVGGNDYSQTQGKASADAIGAADPEDRVAGFGHVAPESETVATSGRPGKTDRSGRGAQLEGAPGTTGGPEVLAASGSLAGASAPQVVEAEIGAFAKDPATDQSGAAPDGPDLASPTTVPSQSDAVARGPGEGRAQGSEAGQAAAAPVLQEAPTQVPDADVAATAASANVLAAREASQAPAGDLAGLEALRPKGENAALSGGDPRSFDDFFALDGTRAHNWRLGIDPASGGTARATDTQAAAAARPQTVGQQLTFAIGNARGGQVEIRLDPAELGRVQIHMHTSEDGVRALVIAERAETQDLLRRHAETLTRDLNDAGFKTVSLDFTSGRETGDEGERGGSEDTLHARASGPAPTPEPAEVAVARPRRLTGTSGLDIRL
jgi:flagellar hook-length control protein FliK